MKKFRISLAILFFCSHAIAQNIPLPSTKSKASPQTQTNSTKNNSSEPEINENTNSSNYDPFSPTITTNEVITDQTALDKLVYDCVKDAIYIVRQDYLLEDNDGRRKGLNNSEIFGSRYGLAIASDNKMWALSSTMCPWIEDENFKTMKKDNKPIRSKIRLRQSDQREFFDTDLVAEVTETERLGYYVNKNLLYYMKGTADRKRTEGRLLLFYTNKGENIEDGFIKHKVLNVDPNWQGNQGKIRGLDASTVNFIGGVYVIEDIVSPGFIVENQTDTKKGGRTRGDSSKKAPVVVSENNMLGRVQYKLVGLYKELDGKSFIISLPEKFNEDILKSSTESKSTEKSSSRRGRR